MAEPTLGVAYADLLVTVAHYLGYGRTRGSWSDEQEDDCDRCVQGGYRMFLSPEPIGEGRGSHTWSFLSPEVDVALVTDQEDYDLPDNFAGFVGSKLTYSSTSFWNSEVEIIGANQIKAWRSRNIEISSSGPPTHAGVEAKTNDGTAGQRWQLLVWPMPKASYTLQGSMVAQRDKLTDAAPYPLGGAMHAQCIEAACLAFAESDFREEEGPKRLAYVRALVSSVEADLRLLTPRRLGKMSDPSTRRREESSISRVRQVIYVP